ncbi:hypothetical protein AMELA_G00266950 [Ameiurus melas]|uniref:Uncharacterized protein n=1 Tax=Ameiurus melas TaxID=219545 RepID=A0A7J5ZPT3_AMEME|nr:hypothetical protein AMELA_G00266950 [Ameiurus melas]
MDYMEFICSLELFIFSSISEAVNIPPNILAGIVALLTVIMQNEPRRETRMVIIQQEQGPMGHPRFEVSPDHIANLLDLNLSVPIIANLLGIRRRTLYRRMAECNLSALYTRLTDEELDASVTALKQSMPHCGYRMMRAALKTQEHRVQFNAPGQHCGSDISFDTA